MASNMQNARRNLQEHSPDNLPRFARAIGRFLSITGGVFFIALLVYLLGNRLPSADMLTFALVLLGTSVLGLLPGDLTRIISQGVQELARDGVFAARLSALEETARMQVLCVEKTGSLTENHPTIASVLPYPPYTKEDVLRLAAMASNETAQEPYDAAILSQVKTAGALPDYSRRISYHPFDYATKHREAVYETDGETLRVMVGLPDVLFDLSDDRTLAGEARRLSTAGYQVQAVAVGDVAHMRLSGLVAFDDPLRADALSQLQELRGLGVKIVIFTRDGLIATQAVAQKIGLEGRTYSAQALRGPVSSGPSTCAGRDSAAYADVLPEDTLRLVEMYQQSGCKTGLASCSGGDALALRQADIGIVTAGAADTARAAAGLILTNPGLTGISTTVISSRKVYQQMLAYCLYRLVMTSVLQWFLGLETLVAGTPLTTPAEFVILLLITYLTATALSDEKVAASRRPGRDNLWSLAGVVFCLALPILLFAGGVSWAGVFILHLDHPRLQTLLFTTLVFIGQGLVYLVRERQPAWHRWPGKRLMICTFTILLIVGLVVVRGGLIPSIPFTVVLGLMIIILPYLVALDLLKARLFVWLDR